MAWELLLRGGRSSSSEVYLQAPLATTEPTPGLIAENSTYWWQLKGTLDSPFKTGLNVNGVPLPRDIAAPDEIWFRWDLGFNAGFADVELTGTSERPWTSRIIIDPVRTKLVRQDFRLMLRDIIEDTRSLAATSGMKERLSQGKRELPIATLEYILESSPRLHKLVSELDKNSRGRLQRKQETVALRDARGITGRQWNGSRRDAMTVSAETMNRLPPQMQDIVEKNSGRLPSRVLQTKSRLNQNRREHAEILGFLHSLIAQLRRSMRALGTGEPRPGELVLHGRCARAARQIASLLDLSVFNGITPSRGHWQHSHLHQRVEPYRSLYRLYRDVKSGVSGIEGDYASVPLQETFRLYETWVSLRLARAAALLDPGLNPSSMFVDIPEQNKLTLSLRSTAAEFSGHALRFKPIFEEVWKTKDGIGSYSRQMIPDVVLEVVATCGFYRRLVILDAKYRVELQLNDAIASIHMYKDALIQEDRSPEASSLNDRPLVTSGLVVVPAPPTGLLPDQDWRTEKMPMVLFRQGYRDRFNLGAIVLRPGTDLDAIATSLSDVITANTGLAWGPHQTVMNRPSRDDDL